VELKPSGCYVIERSGNSTNIAAIHTRGMGRFSFSHPNQFMAPESATPRVRRCELGSRGVSIAAAIERALSVN
jgi:hypothetical protein